MSSHSEKEYKTAVQYINKLYVNTEPDTFQLRKSEYWPKLYAFYKQATLGPCNTEKPGLFSLPKSQVKWDSWNKLGQMSKEDAMTGYLTEFSKVKNAVQAKAEEAAAAAEAKAVRRTAEAEAARNAAVTEAAGDAAEEVSI